MIGAILYLAMQSAAPTPAPPPETPVSVTRPLVAISCELQATDGKSHKLAMQSLGERGFVRRGKVAATEPEFLVTADVSRIMRGAKRLFDNVNLARYSGLWRDNQLAAEQSGSFVKAQFQPAENELVMIKISTESADYGSAFPVVTHVGFCSTTSRAQSPLSTEETERLASR